MDAESLRRTKVDGLKALLRQRGLPVGGKKQDLIDRLQQSQRASGGINVARIPAMTVPVLKSHLRARGLPVGGPKAQLVDRLRTFEACAAKFTTNAAPLSGTLPKGVARPAQKKSAAKKSIAKKKTTPSLVAVKAPKVVKPQLELGRLVGTGDALYVSVDAQARASDLVAAFDMDSTLTRTISGGPFPLYDNDWQWLTPSVPAKLTALAAGGHRIVVFSNQRGVSEGHITLQRLEAKIRWMRSGAGVPICFFFALDSRYAKPQTGMFDYFERELNGSTNRLSSFFVGDMDGACGRRASDKDFARATRLPFITPSVYFTPAVNFGNAQPKASASLQSSAYTPSWSGASAFSKSGVGSFTSTAPAPSKSFGFGGLASKASGFTPAKRSASTARGQQGGVAAAKQFQIPHGIGQAFCSSAADFALPHEPKATPTKTPVRPLANVFECDNVAQFNISSSRAPAAESFTLTGSAPAVVGKATQSFNVSRAAPLRRSEGSEELRASEAHWGCCEQLVEEGREEELAVLLDQAHTVLGGGHSEYAVATVCKALRFMKPPPFSLVGPMVTLIREDARQPCRLAALRALVELIGRFSKDKGKDAVPKNIVADDVFFRILLQKVADVGSRGSALLGILDVEEACLALQVARYLCSFPVTGEHTDTIILFLTDARLLATPKLNELLLALGPVLVLRPPVNTNHSASVNANLIEKFVSLLVHENAEVERLAFRFFSNVTSGTDAQTQQAIDAGIIREAVRCIRTHSCSSPSQALVVDEAWFCLSNIAAGTAPQVARFADHADDLIPLMIQQLENGACVPVVKMDLLQTLSNLLAHKRMSGPGASLDLHSLFAPPALLRAAAPLPKDERSFASLLDPDVLRAAIGTDAALQEAYGHLLVEG